MFESTKIHRGSILKKIAFILAVATSLVCAVGQANDAAVSDNAAPSITSLYGDFGMGLAISGLNEEMGNVAQSTEDTTELSAVIDFGVRLSRHTALEVGFIKPLHKAIITIGSELISVSYNSIYAALKLSAQPMPSTPLSLYAKAGVSFLTGSFDVSGENRFKSQAGFAGGIGAEYKLSKHWVFGLNYMAFVADTLHTANIKHAKDDQFTVSPQVIFLTVGCRL